MKKKQSASDCIALKLKHQETRGKPRPFWAGTQHRQYAHKTQVLSFRRVLGPTCYDILNLFKSRTLKNWLKQSASDCIALKCKYRETRGKPRPFWAGTQHRQYAHKTQVLSFRRVLGPTCYDILNLFKSRTLKNWLKQSASDCIALKCKYRETRGKPRPFWAGTQHRQYAHKTQMHSLNGVCGHICINIMNLFKSRTKRRSRPVKTISQSSSMLKEQHHLIMPNIQVEEQDSEIYHRHNLLTETSYQTTIDEGL